MFLPLFVEVKASSQEIEESKGDRFKTNEWARVGAYVGVESTVLQNNETYNLNEIARITV